MNPLDRLLPRPSRMHRGVMLLLAVLCTAMVVGAGGASAWLRTTADGLVRGVFADAPYGARQLQVYYAGASDDTVPGDAAQRLHASLPQPLREVLEPPRPVVLTGPAVVEAFPEQVLSSPSYLTVVGLADGQQLVEMVAGDFPRPGTQVETLPDDVAVRFDGPRRMPVVEVALQRRAAEELGTSIGSYVNLSTLRYTGPTPERLPMLKVVGIYRASTPYPSPLDDADNARTPAVSDLPEMTVVRAAALAADDLTVLQANWRSEPEVRWTFDPRRPPSAEEAPAVVAAARALEVQPWPAVMDSESRASLTGIGQLAEGALDRLHASGTVMAVVLAALAAAAVALLLAAATLLDRRRREVTEVLRARGAGTGWLARLRGREALLLVAPGLVLAGVLVPTTAAAPVDLVAAGVAALVCAAALVLAQLPTWRALPERLRGPAGDALQIVAVLLGAGLAVLLWRAGELRADDPLLLLVPGVLGAAAAVLVVRGIRLVTRVRGERGQGLGLVGAGVAGASARHILLPVAATVLAASSGLLAAAMADGVQDRAEDAARQEVGADLQVRDGRFDGEAVRRIAELPGVGTVVPVFTATGTVGTTSGDEQVTVLAVDGAAYDRLDPDDSVELGADGGLGAVVSAGLELDDDATLSYAQAEVPLSIMRTAESVPGLADGEAFVLVDVAAFRDAVDRNIATADRLLVEGDPEAARVRAAVDDTSPSAVVVTREAVTDRLLAEPAARRVLLVAAAAAGFSLVATVLGALLVVVLGRPERRRTADVLHALGANRSQRRRVAVLGTMPALGGAVVAGALTAVLLVVLVTAGVDLTLVTGGTS